MFKKLFGGKPQEQPAAAVQPAAAPQPVWTAPQRPYRDYFTVHVHGVLLERVAAALEATYVAAGRTNAAAIVVAADRTWCSAYVEPGLARRVGFNKLASEIAAEMGAWVIGYRIYAGEGMDVHYFQGPTHVDQLAVSEDSLAYEPLDPACFASLADVSSVVPRPAEQHPLDFHFALLEALGIRDAELTWDEALERQRSGGFAAGRVLED